MDVVLVGLALFACALIQVTSGFGFALLAMPLVTLILGLDQAGPVVAAAGLFVNALNALRLHRDLNRSAFLRLSAAAVLGVAPGFWLHDHVPAPIVRATLGALLISYAGYTLLQPARLSPCRALWIWPAGFLGGALAAAYNIPGPPVVVYGDLRAWPRHEYRATLQTFFVLTGLLVVGGHAGLGHFNATTLPLILFTIPALILGNLAGITTDRYLAGDRFRLLVKLLMLATGVALVFPAL